MLSQDDATGYDSFGISVAILGDTVVVGASGHATAGKKSGAIYICKRIQQAIVGIKWRNSPTPKVPL
jgi:hypothetical protein